MVHFAPLAAPVGYLLGAVGALIGFVGHFSRVSLICEPLLWPCVMVLAVLWDHVGPSVRPSSFLSVRICVRGLLLSLTAAS